MRRAGSGMRAALWTLALLAATAAAAPARKEPPKPEAPAPAALTLLDLAKSDRFYLVLDPGRRVLTLSYHSATLREYAVDSMSVGSRSVLFMRSEGPEDWAAHAWADGKLYPAKEIERRELHVTSQGVAVKGETADPSSRPEAPAPPPSAPRAYRIQFNGGFAVEITSAEPAGFLSRAGSWLIGAAHALAGSADDRIRLRLKLPQADADALYRSLPPEPGFVLLGAGS